MYDKIKDELAIYYYGKRYKYLCQARKRVIDSELQIRITKKSN